MRQALMFAVVCACCLAGAWGEDLPQELQSLQPVLEDETKLVEAIRAFDKTQTPLAVQEIDAAKEEKDKLLSQKKMASAQQRLALVQKAYEIGLSRYDGNARLHNYYGELLYDGFGEQEKAVKEWNTALSLDTKLANAHNNLGLHYFHTGSYRLGIQRMDDALRLEPDNPDFLYNMAQIYLVHWPQIQDIRGWSAKQVYKQAMKYSKKAAKLAPTDYNLVMDYAVNFFAGQRCGVKVSWKKAAEAWQTAREAAPTDEDRFYTWLNEARAWMAGENNKQAILCLNAALTLKPDNELAKNLLKKISDEANKASGKRKNAGR